MTPWAEWLHVGADDAVSDAYGADESPSARKSKPDRARRETMLPPAPLVGNGPGVGQSGFFPRAPRVPTWGPLGLEAAARLHERAVHELESGRYARASVRAGRASELIEQLDGAQALDRAEVRLTLGRSLSAEGKLDEAAAVCRLGVKLLTRLRRPEARRARCHLHMVVAQIANKQGRYADARKILLAARRDAAQSFTTADPIFATLANDLGVACKWAGRFEEAQAHYREAMVRLRNRSPRDDHALANLYHNLGGLDHARGRYRPGIRWAKRGLVLREGMVGSDHPDVGADCAALAALLQASGQLTEAEQQLRRALAIFQRARGTDRAEMAFALANLAALSYARQDFAEAERCCRRAFRLQSKLLGAAHPSTATTLGNWAAIAARRGARHRALFLNARALAVLESALGPDHPTVTIHRDNRQRFEQLPAPAARARRPLPGASILRFKDEPRAAANAPARAGTRQRS